MAPSLRCCFLGAVASSSVGSYWCQYLHRCNLCQAWDMEAEHHLLSVRWPSCQLLVQEHVCDSQQEHLPHSHFVGRAVSGDGTKCGPSTGSFTEQASFFALRAEMPWSPALGAPSPSSLEEWKGQDEHPADLSAGGHPGRRGGWAPGRAEPRRKPGLYSVSLLLYFLLDQGKRPNFGPNCWSQLWGLGAAGRMGP